MSNQPLNYCERLDYLAPVKVGQGAAANVKNTAWTEITASTAFDYKRLNIDIKQWTADGGGAGWLFDVAVGGAGSETIIIPNLLYDNYRTYPSSTQHISLPVAIPAGSRISVKAQTNLGAGTRNLILGFQGFGGGVNYPYPPVGNYYDYGTLTASTNATLVDSGAVASTWGAWTELVAATSADHNALLVITGWDLQTGAPTFAEYEWQIGVGGAGSEQIIGGQTYMVNAYTTQSACVQNLFANIPAGTRISARAKAGSTAAAARYLTMAAYGG